MLSRNLMIFAKVSYFAAAMLSLLPIFIARNYHEAGALFFVLGTVSIAISYYKRLEERYQQRRCCASRPR